MTEPTAAAEPLPIAVLKSRRTFSWWWLVPLIAVLLGGSLAYRTWALRGIMITVHLDQGHGLKSGDDVRYRGIIVGTVRRVSLSESLDHVTATVALDRDSADLARAGARFWVVRPQIGVMGVTGLETVVGPRYLATLPGAGARQRRFVALPDAPLIESVRPGDLFIQLQADGRGGLRAGAPILYRQMPIGTILSVGLSSDASIVEARAHIDQAFAPLVTPATRFWRVGGVRAEVGLGGLSVDVASLETLVHGGVALATPRQAGDPVRNGHCFDLADAPLDEWLRWQPLIALGHALLPPGASPPIPQQAVRVREGGWLRSDKRLNGWVMFTELGLLGPADLLQPDLADSDTPVILEIAGAPTKLPADAQWTTADLACHPVYSNTGDWPAKRIFFSANQPVDAIAITDPNAAPMPLSANRFTLEGEQRWIVDAALPIDPSWHGAPVVTRETGKLVGLVIVDEDRAWVALIPRPAAGTD